MPGENVFGGIMQIIQGITKFQLEGKSAAAIGKFDGIHKGHLALLTHILAQKKWGLKTAVFTFDPPASVFFGKTDGKELTPLREKRSFFEEIGVDYLIEFPLNKKTAAIPAERFVEQILASQMHTVYLAAGEDVSFGANGKGDKELLFALARRFGYEVEIIDKLLYKQREISSTYVRKELKQGNMETVSELLGRYYSLTGTVEKGNQLGRRLGMPTLNLYPGEDKLLPPNGVYYAYVHHKGIRYPAITNIGSKPTVNQTSRLSVETYLYDYDRDLYGEEIVTEFLHYKRPEHKFENVEALKSQMEQDLLEGRKYHRLI